MKKFYFVYIICMHMIFQLLYMVCPSETWTFVRHARVKKLSIAFSNVLRNSVPPYCFPLSYNLHLFKGSISMHLASLTITWKPTNKNIDNFISWLSQVWINKLIWKTMSRFWHISYHMKSQSLQLYIFWHFTVILRLLCKHRGVLPFSPKGSVSLLFT